MLDSGDGGGSVNTAVRLTCVYVVRFHVACHPLAAERNDKLPARIVFPGFLACVCGFARALAGLGRHRISRSSGFLAVAQKHMD